MINKSAKAEVSWGLNEAESKIYTLSKQLKKEFFVSIESLLGVQFWKKWILK